jgi:hypothetical protein
LRIDTNERKTIVFGYLTEDEVVAKRQEIFAREAQLEAEQEALNAAIEARGYDGAALMHRVYYETPKAP